MQNPVRVLAIDGGGIRGIVPATILARIERVTGKPIARLFDLIAGTSTGGLLTLALTKPDARGEPEFSAAAVNDLYRSQGARIFSRPWFHRIMALGNLSKAKYTSAGIEAVLAQTFGQARLKDAATDVLITSYEIEKSFPFFFKSSQARRKPDYDFFMRDVARATSAGPTYFEPLKLAAFKTTDFYALVDGGVFANNPAACAYAEALNTHPGREVLLVSLGTGTLTRGIRYEQARNWGVAQWALPILNVIFDGISGTVDYQLKQLLPAYHRLQPILTGDLSPMDDAKPANIAALEAAAARFADQSAAEIDQICHALMASTPEPLVTIGG